MVNVTVNRPGGVNVTVDKKDTGEIVPNITEQPTLVNAGVAQRGVTGTIGTFEDITLQNPGDDQLLIFNIATSSFENRSVSGDLLAYSNGSFELTPTGITPGSYGSDNQAITLTVDYQGRLSAISTSTLRGVTNFNYESSTNLLSLETSDGTTSSVTLDSFGAGATFNDDTVINADLTVTQQLTANNFFGNGRGITDVDAAELDSQTGAFYRVESASYEATNNTITFLRGDSNTFDVTVSGGVTSGELVGNTIILTKSDSTTVDIDMNGLVDNQILTAAFNSSNNTLTLSQDDSGSIEVDLNAGVSSAAFAISNNTVTFTRTDSTNFDVALTGLANTSAPTFTGNVTVTGNLNVLGTTTTIDTSNVLVEDPILLLGKNNGTPAIDFGFYGQRYDDPTDTNLNVAYIWDESADEFATVFTEDDANNSVLTVSSYADFRANTITVSHLSLSPNVNINVSGDVSGNSTAQLTNLNTDADLTLFLELDASGVTPGTYGSASLVPILTIDEHGRVNNATTTSVAGVSDFRFVSANGTIEIDTADGGFFAAPIDLSSFSTSNLSEGTNLYFTNSRVDSRLSSGSITSDIITTGKILYSNIYSAEGDLPNATTYHGMFAHVHGTGKGYFAHAGAWIKLLDESSSSTTDLSEGTNLYYTVQRANTAIDDRVTKLFVDALNVNAAELNNNSGDFYRVESASYEASNNTITFTRGDANTFDVTVSGGVTSGSLVGNTIILTKSDSTTVDIDMNGLVDDLIISTNWHTSNNTLQLLTDDNTAFNNNISQFDANVTFSNTVVINSITDYTSNSLTTTATTQVNLDTFAIASSRTAKYIISVKEGTKFHSTEIMLLHDGTDVYITEYAKLITDSDLATFTADISGSDLRLRVTPASTNSTEFKLSRQLLSV